MSPSRRAASHDPDGFVTALSAMSENTRRAYEHDAREFVEWCERGGTDAQPAFNPTAAIHGALHQLAC